MKHMLTLGCRLLAIYFGTLALTLFLADALRGKRAWAWEPIHGTETATAPTVPGGGNADCPPCREGWLTITDMYGGIECEHGPEHSPGCPRPPHFNPARDCWEENGNKVSPVTGLPCKCYDCVAGLTRCEADFLRWVAWCGWETAPGGSCPVQTRTDVLTVRYARPAVVDAPDKKCTWGSGYESKKHCGKDKVELFGCKANVPCKGVGDWQPIEIRPLERCKPVQGDIPPAPTATSGQPL